jgi:hypothetical protein
MLRNQAAYAASTLSPQKPVWHWSQLFTGSAFIDGTDIDLFAEYKGHSIFI